EVGSGKTTLLRLLAGLVRADRGEVLVNDRPIEQIRWDDYRRTLGYAPQESLLFSESIRENIELGRDGNVDSDDPDRAEDGRRGEDRPSRNRWLDRLLALVHLDVEVAKMPRGVETVLRQQGTRISGGQPQR